MATLLILSTLTKASPTIFVPQWVCLSSEFEALRQGIQRFKLPSPTWSATLSTGLETHSHSHSDRYWDLKRFLLWGHASRVWLQCERPQGPKAERGGTRWNEVGLGKPDLPRLIFLAQDPLANCEASWSRAIADSAGANSVHHCCPSRGGVGWGWGQFAETKKRITTVTMGPSAGLDAWYSIVYRSCASI